MFQLFTGALQGPLYPMPIPSFAIAYSPKCPFSCSYRILLCLPTSGSKSHSVFYIKIPREISELKICLIYYIFTSCKIGKPAMLY